MSEPSGHHHQHTVEKFPREFLKFAPGVKKGVSKLLHLWIYKASNDESWVRGFSQGRLETILVVHQHPLPLFCGGFRSGQKVDDFFELYGYYPYNS